MRPGPARGGHGTVPWRADGGVPPARCAVAAPWPHTARVRAGPRRRAVARSRAPPPAPHPAVRASYLGLRPKLEMSTWVSQWWAGSPISASASSTRSADTSPSATMRGFMNSSHNW